MKSFVLLLIPLMFNMMDCRCQDSLTTQVSKLELSGNSIIYAVSVRNTIDKPICILHSVFIDLNAGVPQSIVPYTTNKSGEFFGLSYSVKDTTMIVERTLYDGEILMPHQVLNFKISVPKTNKTKNLYFEFIGFSDFCYEKLMNEMKKAATWYNNYERSKVVLNLPD